MKLSNLALVGLSTLLMTSTVFAQTSACSSHIDGAKAVLSCTEDNGSRTVCLYDAGSEIIVQMRGDDQYGGIFEETLEKHIENGTLLLSKSERSISTYAKTTVRVSGNGEGYFENVYKTLNLFDHANLKSKFSMNCQKN